MYLHTMSFSSKVSTSRCLSVASREFQYLKYINYVRSKIYLTLGILYLDQQQCTKIISGIFSQPSIKSWKVEVIVALYRPCSVNKHTPLFINPISCLMHKSKDPKQHTRQQKLTQQQDQPAKRAHVPPRSWWENCSQQEAQAAWYGTCYV